MRVPTGLLSFSKDNSHVVGCSIKSKLYAYRYSLFFIWAVCQLITYFKACNN